MIPQVGVRYTDHMINCTNRKERMNYLRKIIAFSLAFLAIMYSGNCYAASDVSVPVLMYHIVSTNPDPSNEYQVSLTEFKKQMDYLKNNGYTTLSIDEYHNILNKTTSMPSKPVLLTFDDGTSDFYSNVYPILKQYAMKATSFVVTNWIDASNYMTTSQIKTIIANSIDVQNHTTTHQNLTGLTYNQKYKIINDANTKMKSIMGKPTTSFAYPYGEYDSDSISILKNLDYKTVFKGGGGITTNTSDKYALPRIMISGKDTLPVFTRKLITGN